MGFWSVRRKWKEQGRSASFPSDSVKLRAPPITKQLAKLTVFGLEDCLFWACAGGSYFLGFECVLVAQRCGNAELHYAAEGRGGLHLRLTPEQYGKS